MSRTQEFRVDRARYGSLKRSRPADDPELQSERQAMRESSLLTAVEKALADAPPLSPELRARIVGLLS